MGVDVNSKSYIQDKQAFQAYMSKHYPSNQSSHLQSLEQKEFAKRGNSYAQHQCGINGKADISITQGQSDTVTISTEAQGKAGDFLNDVSDATTFGAHRELSQMARDLKAGNGAQAGVQLLTAGVKMGGAVVLGWGADKVAAKAVGRTGLRGLVKEETTAAAGHVLSHAAGHTVSHAVGSLFDSKH